MPDNFIYHNSGSFNATGMLENVADIIRNLGEWDTTTIVAVSFCALCAVVAYRCFNNNRSIQLAHRNTIAADASIAQTGSVAAKFFTTQKVERNTLQSGSKIEQTFK